IGLLMQAALMERATPTDAIARPISQRIGLSAFLFAVFLLPLLLFASGRPLMQTESFAFMPDPTALASVGVFVAWRRLSGGLLVIPFLWSVYSGLTLYSLGSKLAMVPICTVALSIALGAARWCDRRIGRPRVVP